MEFFTPTINEAQQIKDAMKNNRKPSCEMSVANTVLWAKHYKTQICFFEGQIVYRSQFLSDRYSYSCNLYSSKDPKALFDYVVQLAKAEEQPLQMHCILKEEFDMINQWYPEQYSWTVRRQDCDYLYEREKLATLSGKKLHAKRNHINRFIENYPDWSYEAIDDKNQDECARMAMQWCLTNCADENDNWEYDKIDESKLVVYAIRHRDALGMIGGAIRAQGRIVAVTLGEQLTDEIFVVHFEKAFSDIQGAYPMMNREFVRNELNAYQYVNREEDLGEEGLRKAKLSYRPYCILEKGAVNEIM